MGVVVPDSLPADAGKLSLITRTVIKCTDFAVKQKQCIQLRLIKAAAYHALAREIHLQQFVTEEKYCYWLQRLIFSLCALTLVSVVKNPCIRSLDVLFIVKLNLYTSMDVH